MDYEDDQNYLIKDRQYIVTLADNNFEVRPLSTNIFTSRDFSTLEDDAAIQKELIKRYLVYSEDDVIPRFPIGLNNENCYSPPAEFGDMQKRYSKSPFSKTTQTPSDLHDQAVNTTIVSVSISTQTSKCNDELSDNNTSNDRINQLSISGSSRNINESDYSAAGNTDDNQYPSENEYVNQNEAEEEEENSPEVNERYEEINVESNSFSKSIAIENPKTTAAQSEIMRYLSTDTEHECTTYLYIPHTVNAFSVRRNYNYSGDNISRLSELNMSKPPNGSAISLWEFRKVFELRKVDEVIQSHLARTDRRLKATSNRMGCQIEIFGPYRISEYLTTFTRTDCYQLTIAATSKARLEKAINCLFLSFPNSNFNERYIGNRFYFTNRD